MRVLYDKYSARMYSICIRYTKDPDDANDIFQDGFYLGYKNIGQLKNIEALSGWIKRIFINAAIEHFKKKKTILLEELEHHTNNLHINWNEGISILSTEEITSFIQELPVGCQTVFNMFSIDGYSHKEIAEHLQLSIGTSKSQLYDARKILKQKMAHIINDKKSIPNKK